MQLSVLENLAHPNLQKVLKIVKDSKDYLFLLETPEGIPLFEFLKQISPRKYTLHVI